MHALASCVLVILVLLETCLKDSSIFSTAQRLFDLRADIPWRKGALVVPNARVAGAIHLAVAGSIYGDETIKNQQPFQTVRSEDYWVVFGSLPKNMLGGTAVTVIRASNDEVMRVIHER